MSTFETMKEQIRELIDLSNATTGNTDTNLTDGVNALIGGYGQGGSSKNAPFTSSITGKQLSPQIVTIASTFSFNLTNEIFGSMEV